MVELLPLIDWHMWVVVFIHGQLPVLIYALDWRMLQIGARLRPGETTCGTCWLFRLLAYSSIGVSCLRHTKPAPSWLELETIWWNFSPLDFVKVTSLYLNIDQRLILLSQFSSLGAFVLLRAPGCFVLTYGLWQLSSDWFRLLYLFRCWTLFFGFCSLRLLHKLSLYSLSVLFECIEIPFLQNSLQEGLVLLNKKVFQVFVLI